MVIREYLKTQKTAVPLKYLRNFWRSLKMPFIDCKIHLELSWTKDCVMSSVVGATAFNKHRIIRSNCYFIKQRQCKTGKTIRRRI